jgi:parallel beta-helix repeat protein
MRQKLALGLLLYFAGTGSLLLIVQKKAAATHGLDQGEVLVEVLVGNESQSQKQLQVQSEEQEETSEHGTSLQELAGEPWWMETGISIRADGCVYPWGGLGKIFREADGTYVLIDDIYLGHGFEGCPACGSYMPPDGRYCLSCGFEAYRVLYVEADNIVIDGAGYSILGEVWVYVVGRNVTLKNLNVIQKEDADGTIRFIDTENCLFVNSTVQCTTDKPRGPQGGGIWLESTNHVTLRNVEVKNFAFGIIIEKCKDTILDDNTISGSGAGVIIDSYWSGWHEGCQVGSNNTVLIGNTIANNWRGIGLGGCVGTIIRYNSFIDNNQNVNGGDCTLWDEVTPDGNYWHDYVGQDSNGDWVGDTPYLICQDNDQDRYPLMKPWTGIPEPTLLPILGLVLLPALLWRRG